MIKIKKTAIFLTLIFTALLCGNGAYAYNIVDLPETMTMADALEIYDADKITSASVANIGDDKYIPLSGDEIKDFYYSAANIMLHRTINPTPFRGTSVNFETESGNKSFFFSSGVQIGMYGTSNYICYEMEDYDLSKFMYLYSKYEESEEKQNGAPFHRCTDNDFLKLPSDVWAQSPVKEAAARSLVPYSLTGKYSANISREEFCMLIGNLIAVSQNYSSLESYMSEKNSAYSRDNFADCTGKDKSIDILFNLGVVSGRGGEYFDPDGCITREEAAKMLTSAASLFKYIGSGYTLKYADNGKISSWAPFYVKWVTENGIMNGVDNNCFEPQGTYTVQQAIATVSRLYNVITQ